MNVNRYTLCIIGSGRAGQSFATAFQEVGHEVFGPFKRDFISDPLFFSAIQKSNAIIFAVSDSNIGFVADEVYELLKNPESDLISFNPDSGNSNTVISKAKHFTPVAIHLSGSKGLDIFSNFENRASIHPLVPLPDSKVGSARLLSKISFTVAGDKIAYDLVESLGGKVLTVDDEKRAFYHATCSVASNFLVGLMGQVEKMANECGLDLNDFIKLCEFSLEDVKNIGVKKALTGPVVRKDYLTVKNQRQAIEQINPEDLSYFDSTINILKEIAESIQRS